MGPVGNFGERLKRERELRGKSLEEIAASTKIGTRSLQALEDENFEKLPGGIFNKGFVRSYARFLGLDEEELVSSYKEAEVSKQKQQMEKIQAASEMIAAEQPETRAPVWLPFVVIVALAVMALLGWRFWLSHHSGESWPERTTAAPAETYTRKPTTGASAIPSAAKSSRSSSEGSPGDQEQLGSGVVPQGRREPAAQAAGKRLEKITEESHSAVTDFANFATEAVRVEIAATQACWISVTADGKSVTETVLKAGEKKSVQGKQLVIVRLGNAAGVRVSMNGKELPSLGKEKEIKTLTFTSAGLQH